jgi:hypothetical protein
MLARIFEDASWYMRPSERAALSGLLAELRPAVAVEIGTCAGGSLVCLAEHAAHVHTFDLAPPPGGMPELPNVTLHTGDSHVLLPIVMEELAASDVSVEFALVDGDHSADGVRRDVEDLLGARALSRGIVVIHDTANPEVRDGLERVEYEAHGNVTWVDLDWLPGYISTETGEAWAGLGLIVVDANRGRGVRTPVRAGYAVPFPEFLGLPGLVRYASGEVGSTPHLNEPDRSVRQSGIVKHLGRLCALVPLHRGARR